MKNKLKEININLKLQELADKYMIAYKSDVQLTINDILECGSKNTFYIYIRKTGICLMSDFVFFKGTFSNIEALYYNLDEIKYCAKITVSKRENNILTGIFEKMQADEFIKKVKETAKEVKGADTTLILKDGQKFNYVCYHEGYKGLYEAVVSHFNVCNEKVEKLIIHKLLI